jgi:hypothetical protein
MNAVTRDTTVTAEAEGLAIVVPPRLLAAFEKAERQLREIYGIAPDVPTLVRLWLTCATVSRIRKEFEAAVQQLDRTVLDFDQDDDEDGDDL